MFELGGGPYGPVVDKIRAEHDAAAVLLVVLTNDGGGGYSIAADRTVSHRTVPALSALLRNVADELDRRESGHVPA